ncbi:MAG: HlyC/CorC family transporter [Burkholderiaceae bacterium]|nr:MAG: HlyC/CorC family transporter [Burkholderiaceae bacterium]
MDTIPLWAQITALVALLLLSGFFSIAETSMMALNRFRVRHLAKSGKRSARMALALLHKTDRFLSMVLIGNTLLNAATTTLVTALAIYYFGNDETVLSIATGIVAFLILVFSELTPKVVGAAYAEQIALPSSLIFSLLVRLFYPLIWFVNLFVTGILKLLRLRSTSEDQTTLSTDELRSLVLESAQFMPKKHRSILLNLFDLEQITVDDVMTPRAHIEALDITQDLEQLRAQLATCYHNKLLVYERDINQVKGLLHVRQVLALLDTDTLNKESLLAALSEPYYIPAGTAALAQLQNFQEKKLRLGLVVDEYGEVEGLVTLADIVEEVVGEFTSTMPAAAVRGLHWDEDGLALVEGQTSLRKLNRRLGLHFSLDGPKTLNGLLLEYLQDIPETGVSVKIAGCPIEIVQVHDRLIRVARLQRPRQTQAPGQ